MQSWSLYGVVDSEFESWPNIKWESCYLLAIGKRLRGSVASWVILFILKLFWMNFIHILHNLSQLIFCFSFFSGEFGGRGLKLVININVFWGGWFYFWFQKTDTCTQDTCIQSTYGVGDKIHIYRFFTIFLAPLAKLSSANNGIYSFWKKFVFWTAWMPLIYWSAYTPTD